MPKGIPGHPQCSIVGCDAPHLARGWCSKHYERWKAHGDPLYRRPTLEERFWSKVDKRAPDDCWHWLANKTASGGYGKIGRGGKYGPTIPAHRLAYELIVGPIPGGLHLDHLCRNPSCVNPTHLEPVTAGENTRRGNARFNGGHNRRKTHCPAGHPYAGDNLAVDSRGSRACRTCHREQDSARKARFRFEEDA